MNNKYYYFQEALHAPQFPLHQVAIIKNVKFYNLGWSILLIHKNYSSCSHPHIPHTMPPLKPSILGSVCPLQKTFAGYFANTIRDLSVTQNTLIYTWHNLNSSLKVLVIKRYLHSNFSTLNRII